MLAFRAHAAMGVLWKLLIGAAYVAIGLYLFWHPLLGVASLTLLLGCLFVVEGVLGVVLYFQMRPLTGVTWTLLDGLVTLLLGLLIWIGWPSSSAWVIGTLVGISMIMSGLTRVMLSLAVRRIVNQAA
jgi:uncharacterized membrane protein HdeD (DUF308 family)